MTKKQRIQQLIFELRTSKSEFSKLSVITKSILKRHPSFYLYDYLETLERQETGIQIVLNDCIEIAKFEIAND